MYYQILIIDESISMIAKKKNSIYFIIIREQNFNFSSLSLFFFMKFRIQFEKLYLKVHHFL
jgi:hypothetical protein